MINKEDDDLIFVCLGDSLTAGGPGFSGWGSWSGNIQSQYEYWLEQKVNEIFPEISTEIVNFGKGGDVVWQMLYRYNNDVIRIFPKHDFVIVMGGINDILGRAALAEDVISDLAELFSVINESSAKIIAMEVAPSTVTNTYVDRIKVINEGIANLVKKYNGYLIPLYQALTDSSGNKLDRRYDIGDGIHFNVAGYKKIGETLFDSAIKGILEKVIK